MPRGGFDERFPLYFEENDFLRRVQRRHRLRSVRAMPASLQPERGRIGGSGVAVRAIGAALPAQVGRRIREAI